MSRPPKCRRVEFMPELTYFKPAGVPLMNLEEVSITIEELEAIRLKDVEGLEQEACAERMGVSRPTYHRILSSARSKVSKALVEGKAIRIEGGHFQVSLKRYRCRKCGHEWEAPQKELDNCPECKEGEVSLLNGQHGKGHRCQRRQKKRQAE